MLRTPTQQFHPWPFDKEAELEATISEVKAAFFGESRIDLGGKKFIGERGKTQNISRRLPARTLLAAKARDLVEVGQAPRYTSYARLQKARTLDDVF